MFLLYAIPTVLAWLIILWPASLVVREYGGRGRGDIRRVAVWGAVLGFLGFLGGFFGPLYIGPESPQGPLFGIFISGPAGALAGYVAGAARSLYLVRHRGTPMA
jgi:hypothetical protein